MKSFKPLVLATLALLLGSLSLVAGAESPPVYRCGDSYSQTPCPNATKVQANDPRDDSQRAAAQAALARDKAALAQAEAAHNKPLTDKAGDKATDKKSAATAAKKKTPQKRSAKVKKEDGPFTAKAPGTAPKKKPKKAKP